MKIVRRRQGCLSSCKDLLAPEDPYRMTGKFDEVYKPYFHNRISG